MFAGKISKYSMLAVASAGGATENSKGSSVRLDRQNTRSRKGGVDSRSTLSAAEGWSAIDGRMCLVFGFYLGLCLYGPYVL
jgi:hypothetical protein